jgi:hypothetical protein
MPRYTTLTLALRLAGQRRIERRAPREPGQLFCRCGKLASTGWSDGGTHVRCCACEVGAGLEDFVYVPAYARRHQKPQDDRRQKATSAIGPTHQRGAGEAEREI